MPSRTVADEITATSAARVVRISGENAVAGGVYSDGTTLIDDRDGGHHDVATLAGLATLPGNHNAQNAAAAKICKDLPISTPGTIPNVNASQRTTIFLSTAMPYRVMNMYVVTKSKNAVTTSTDHGNQCFLSEFSRFALSGISSPRMSIFRNPSASVAVLVFGQ